MRRTMMLASLTTMLGLAPLFAEDPAATTPDAATQDTATAAPAALPTELATVDGLPTPLQVSSKKQLTLPTPKVENLGQTELWYRSYDGTNWGEWAKHGIVFDAQTPIVWNPSEGIWQIYERPITTAGLAAPAPVGAPPEPKLSYSFIIDRTAPTVEIDFPTPNFILRGGDHYTIKWKAEDPYLRAAPITLLYSRDGKSFDVIAQNIPNKGEFDWLTPIDMTTSGQIRIEATDKADNVGSAVNTGLMIDSIKPNGRVVGPPISDNLTTSLQLDIKDGGPSGVESARLWVSQDDGTSWTEGPWIKESKSLDWKAPGDGTYRLAIVAVDRAGNTSPIPKGQVGDVLIVDTTPPLVTLNAAIGIIPANAAVGNNNRAFKKGDRVQVQFIVKDAHPLPNSVSVYLQTEPNKWIELTHGQPLDQAFRFEIPDVATKEARIKVTASDIAGNVGEAVAGESFEIQNQIIIDGGTDTASFLK